MEHDTVQTAQDELSLPDGLSEDQLRQIQEQTIARQREIRQKSRDSDLLTAKELVEKHGFKWADLRPATKAGSTVAPKYRDPETGAEWSGRGRAPLWIRDVEDRDQFLIET